VVGLRQIHGPRRSRFSHGSGRPLSEAVAHAKDVGASQLGFFLTLITVCAFTLLGDCLADRKPA